MDDMILYDENKNILLESKIQILGLYSERKKMWQWGWSLFRQEAKRTYLSRKIFDYAWNINDKNMLELRHELIKSDVYIKNMLQIEFKLALTSYITKKNFILKFPVLPNDEIDMDEDGIINYNKLLKTAEKNKGLVEYIYYVIMDY